MAPNVFVISTQIGGFGGTWWAAVYGVAQSRTWLKQLSSSILPFDPFQKRDENSASLSDILSQLGQEILVQCFRRITADFDIKSLLCFWDTVTCSIVLSDLSHPHLLLLKCFCSAERKLRAKKLMHLNCGVGEDSWKSPGLQGDPTSPFWRRSVLGVHWKDWCWSWNSHTLGTWCAELTYWKRPWCWTRLKAGGEGDDRGWDIWLDGITSLMDMSLTKLPGVGDGQGSLACCSPWGCKELDTTEQLNWTDL